MSPLRSTYFLLRQSDDGLVAAARSGNAQAFEVLVRRHHKQLLAYARRLIGTDARAEDVLQQALMQAWIALNGDAAPEQVKPWLFRIVHNVAVSALRRPTHRIVALDEALDTAEHANPVDARLALRDAMSGVAALPEPQRSAMVLTAFGGESHDEAAATLGLTDGAVRGLIYRARAALRAAAAVFPGPIGGWIASRATRSGRAAGLLTGSGSVSAGGAILKVGAIAATAGALAAGSQIIPTLGSVHRHIQQSGAAGRAGGPGSTGAGVVAAHGSQATMLYGIPASVASAGMTAYGTSRRAASPATSGRARRVSFTGGGSDGGGGSPDPIDRSRGGTQTGQPQGSGSPGGGTNQPGTSGSSSGGGGSGGSSTSGTDGRSGSTLTGANDGGSTSASTIGTFAVSSGGQDGSGSTDGGGGTSSGDTTTTTATTTSGGTSGGSGGGTDGGGTGGTTTSGS